MKICITLNIKTVVFVRKSNQLEMAQSVFSEAYFGVGFLVFSGTFPRYIGRNIAFINSLCTLMHSSLPFLPHTHTASFHRKDMSSRRSII
jgi:hypothetical protein